MNARNELAETVFDLLTRVAEVGTTNRNVIAHGIAMGLEDAGYSKPRTVDSAAEVHSLCVGTIVRDAEGDVYELWEEDIHTDRMRLAWMKPGDEFSYYDPTLPATILFAPGDAG